MALATSLADLKVILVEPSSTQAHLVTRMLQELGVGEIEACTTAAEALKLVAGYGRLKVVLSALYLPDMPGTELVAALRENEQTESLPFILISSETRPQVLDPVRQSGACSIIAKPFTVKQLERALFAAADYLKPPQDSDSAEVEQLRVLLVDDSRSTRNHLTRVLKDLGITRVTQAENGLQAIKILEEMTVDMVITDYNMPEMDGQALVEYIRTQSWQSSVPILMVTSEQHEGRLAAVQKAGVSAICDKPFDATSIRTLMSLAMAS